MHRSLLLWDEPHRRALARHYEAPISAFDNLSSSTLFAEFCHLLSEAVHREAARLAADPVTKEERKNIVKERNTRRQSADWFDRAVMARFDLTLKQQKSKRV